VRRAAAALRGLVTDAGKRPGLVEAVLRLAGVACLVAFANCFGDRWGLLAAGVGLFVLTSEHSL
jgi:hypothetical protein